MTELTEESLERLLLNLTKHIDEVGERVSLIPKHIIVPPAIFRNLMWRPPIRKARSIRGRKRAISRRPAPMLWKMIKGQA